MQLSPYNWSEKAGSVTTPKHSEYISIRVAPEVKEELEAMAAVENRTLSYIVNRIIDQHLAGL